MIERVGTVSLFVADQDRAKRFYTEVLGLELRGDTPLFPGATTRWLTVAPKGAETEIILYLPDQNWEHYKATVGKSQALTLNVRHMASYHRELLAKGVIFVQEPSDEAWGRYAIIKDSEGNNLILVGPPAA